MATQRIYITKNHNDPHDGDVKARDNGQIGRAKNRQGPNETYIDVQLDDHWIITDEELKEYRKLKNGN